MLFLHSTRFSILFPEDFHRDYEESAPGKVCYSFEEVLSAITDKDFEYEKLNNISHIILII